MRVIDKILQEIQEGKHAEEVKKSLFRGYCPHDFGFVKKCEGRSCLACWERELIEGDGCRDCDYQGECPIDCLIDSGA